MKGTRKGNVRGLNSNFIVHDMMYFQQAITIDVHIINRILRKYSSNTLVQNGIKTP